MKGVKAFCVMGGALLLYAVAGFYLLPAALKSKIPEIIERTTGRKASVARIQFNPFSLEFGAQGFELQEANGKPFAAFDSFYININALQSITSSALLVDNARLTKPFLGIARHKNGDFNFNDLLKDKGEAQPDDGKIFPVTIVKLALSEGKLSWKDASADKPVNEDIEPLNLTVENFTTEAGQQFPLGLSLALKSGGKLDWQGVAGINPVFSSGRIQLDNVKLERMTVLAPPDTLAFELKGNELFNADYRVSYANNVLDLEISRSRIEIQDFLYAEKGRNDILFRTQNIKLEAAYKTRYANNKWEMTADKTRLDLGDVQLSGVAQTKTLVKVPKIVLEADARVDYADKSLNLTVSHGKFDIRKFDLSEQGQDKSLVNIARLVLQGIGLNLANRELAVDSITAEEADVQASLNADGRINYQNLLPAAKTETSPSEKAATIPAPAQQPPWRIAVKSIAFNNVGLTFEDRTLKKPVLMNAKPVNIKLTDFTTQAGARLPFKIDARINETGAIKLDGDAVIEPLSAQLTIAVDDFALEPFQPYVDRHARLDVIDGKLNLDGKLTFAMTAEGKPDLKFKGNSGIAELLTRDQLQHKDFVKWENLTFKDIDADWQANRYTSKLLLIEKPYARVIIRKDKSVNVNDILIADKSRSGKPVGTERKKQPDPDKPYFKLDKIQVKEGSSDFADLSLILPFAAPIKSLDGGASGVSSEQKSKVKVSLKGNAYDLAPVDITGEISPYLGDYNVEMNFHGMPMPLVSPYMVQFAGYKVEKGKLTLGLKYQVVNRQLTASNSIYIDQFELGEKVENPNAVSIPLELAVALLKDSDGKIKMDVPITGSLEDPKFSLGKIITQALLNSITKVVAAPFNAIASLIGSEENLSVISFTPGKAVLDIKQMTKLDSIAHALKDRPVLSIEIKGAVFQEQDWPAMREAALYDHLKKLKAAEENKKGGKKILPEYVELSDKEYKRLLAQMFIEKFPLMAEKSLLGTPRLVQPEAGDFYVIAKQKLSEIIKPEPERLKDLAADRAQVIAKYIVQHGGISNDRVFILDTVIDPKRDNTDIVSFLSLKAK